MKWVFASLTVAILALVVYEAKRPASEPTVTIEGRQVPYRLVHVWDSDGPGEERVVEYHDPELEIDYSERFPVAKADEIVAFQAASKAAVIIKRPAVSKK
jgi:hypothetical protein